MLDLNGDEETGLDRTIIAWDVDDLWCNPAEDLPDPAPNLLDIESSRLLQGEKDDTTYHLTPQVCSIRTKLSPGKVCPKLLATPSPNVTLMQPTDPPYCCCCEQGWGETIQPPY